MMKEVVSRYSRDAQGRLGNVTVMFDADHAGAFNRVSRQDRGPYDFVVLGLATDHGTERTYGVNVYERPDGSLDVELLLDGRAVPGTHKRNVRDVVAQAYRDTFHKPEAEPVAAEPVAAEPADGETFTLIGRPTLQFRVVRRYEAAGFIPSVVGVTLDGKRQTHARVEDCAFSPPAPPPDVPEPARVAVPAAAPCVGRVALLTTRCIVAARPSPAECVRIVALAALTALSMRDESKASRMWLGQMRAAFRRAMAARAAVEAAIQPTPWLDLLGAHAVGSAAVLGVLACIVTYLTVR